MLYLDLFVFDALHLVALAEILHKCDPSKRRELQHSCSNQNRHSSPILAQQLFFIGSAGSEPQAFFMRQFIQARVFRRREIGPAYPARREILAAVTD